MKIENLIAIDILLSHQKADEGLESLQKSFNKFRDTISDTSGQLGGPLDDVSTKMENMGSKLSSVGSTMTKFVSVPIVGALGATVGAAAQFESAFASVRKTVDGTPEQMADLSNAIKDMSTTMPATTTEISAVAEAAGQLGIEIENIEEFTKVMINLGVSTNLASDEAAESFARLFNIMDEGPDSYSRAGAAIVDLGNNYATNERQIMNFTMRLAAAGKQVGMSTADVMGMATGLSAMGISAEAGGSAVSKFMVNMSNAVSLGTGTMRDLEKQTGMTWREMQLMSTNAPREFRALAQSIGRPTDELKRFIKAGKDAEQMADVMGISVDELSVMFEENAAGAVAMFIDGLGKVEQGLSSTTLTGEDAVAILTEMGITEVRLRDALLRSANAGELFNQAIIDGNKAWDENTALTREASIRYETFDSQWQMFKNTLSLIATNMGEQLLPMLKELVKWMQGFADKIANMDPKKFQAIAKSLIGIAAIGPGLKIAGTAMQAMGTIGKAANVVGTMGGILDASKKLTTTYKDGGWTGIAINYFKELGYSLRKNGTLMREDGTTATANFSKEIDRLWDKFPAGRENLLKFTDNLDAGNIASTGFSTALKGLGNNPMVKGAGWLAVIAYASTLYTEFEWIQDIVKAIVSPFVALGKVFIDVGKWLGDLISKVTDGAIGFGDIAVAVGGVVAVMTGFAPVIGGVLAALAGAKAIFGIFRGATKETEEAVFGLSENTMAKLEERVNNVSNAYTKFVAEETPGILEAYQSIHDKITTSSLTPDNKELQVSSDDYLEYTNRLSTYAATSREKLRNEIESGFKERGIIASTYAQNELAAFDARTEEEVAKRKTLTEQIEGLLEKRNTANSGWNLKDEEELARHLDELENIARIKEMEANENELERLRIRIERKKMLGHELTEDEYNTLNELMATKLGEQNQLITDNYYGQIENLRQLREDQEITEKEYAERAQALYELMYSEELKNYKSHAAEYLSTITNMDAQKIEQAADIATKLKEIEYDILEAKEAAMISGDETQLKALEAQRQAFLKEKENLNISKTEWENLTSYLKTVLPPEYADVMEDIKDEMSFQDIMTQLTTDSEKLYIKGKDISLNINRGLADGLDSFRGAIGIINTGTQKMITGAEQTLDINSPSGKFKTIGKYVSEGLEQGISNNQSGPIRAAANMASKAFEAAKNFLGIKSPSRLFRGMGRFVPEGMALGIDDETHLAVQAARDMSDEIAAATDPIGDYGVKGTATLRKHMEVTTDSQFISTLRGAIIDAFSESGPITAYIGKEEAKENFETNLLKSLSGQYNR